MTDVKKILSISEPTLRRLPVYHRYLAGKAEAGAERISCTEIASDLGFTSIQVRKDLQQAGASGTPRTGYQLKKLIKTVGEALGYGNMNEAFLVGAGNFGQLILNYGGFSEYGFKIIAAFDSNPAKVGAEINGIQVLNVKKFPDLAARMKIKIAILAVNASAAQEVTDMMQKAGIEAIWNLTHEKLNTAPGVIVQDVNLGASLSLLLSKLHAKYRK